MAKNKKYKYSKPVDNTVQPARVEDKQVVISNDPVVSDEMIARYSGLSKDILKVGIITVALIVVLTILWFVFK